MTEHTSTCLEAQLAIENYRESWPHRCSHCYGWGYIYSSFDPSPAGVSLSSGWFDEEDPCPDCLVQGKCPRCRNEVWKFADIDELPNSLICVSCAWHKKEGGEPEYECACWVKELEQAERDYVRLLPQEREEI